LSFENLKVLAMPAYKNVSSNPYNFLLTEALSKQDVEVKEYSLLSAFLLRYDIIHVHWPEWYLSSHYYLKALSYSLMFVASLFWCRLFGKKVVWTVHNLSPHKIKYPFLNRWFWRVYLPQVDGIISLSNANQRHAITTYPLLLKVAKKVTYHGLYTDYYPKTASIAEARKRLQLPEGKIVFLCLGQIKEYKRPDLLVNIFKNNGIENAILVIAGKFEENSYRDKLVKDIGDDKSIILFEGFVSDDELQYYYLSADFSVIPFGAIFNSGSALLSISYNVPVILPYSESFEEYDALLNKGFYLYQGDIDKNVLSRALEGYVSEEHCLSNNSPLNWCNIAIETKKFYTGLRN
jgi:beta-1,4-mannosyltransferase